MNHRRESYITSELTYPRSYYGYWSVHTYYHGGTWSTSNYFDKDCGMYKDRVWNFRGIVNKIVPNGALNSGWSGGEFWGSPVDYYMCKYIQYYYCKENFTANPVSIYADDQSFLLQDNVFYYRCGANSCATGTYSITFHKGWNKLECCYWENAGGACFNMSYDIARTYLDKFFYAGPFRDVFEEEELKNCTKFNYNL